MTDPAATAAALVSFQLTYARSPVQRRFEPGFLTGPPIPCAYGSDLDASGAWEDGGDAGEVFAARGRVGGWRWLVWCSGTSSCCR